MKNTLRFNCSTNILVRLLTVNMKNCLSPKIRKCALVTLLKMRPHYSQSSRENVTSSGGTSQLASSLFYTMQNFLLTPPLLIFLVSFCFPPPPHTFAELIPSQVYAFSTVLNSQIAIILIKIIEFSLWQVVRQLLATCFSDDCLVDRRLLRISGSTHLPLAKSTPERETVLFCFAQKQTFRRVNYIKTG